jgi:hypothetical protein
MKQPRLEYHTTRMWISVLLAIGYGSAFLFFYTLTGSTTLDGIIGILLGLYVGAHPAAHLIDLLYLPHGTRRELLSSEPGLVWLVVNVLVVVVGIFTIVIGANRFVQPARDGSLSMCRHSFCCNSPVWHRSHVKASERDQLLRVSSRPFADRASWPAL